MTTGTEMLERRDPVVARAVEAHGAEWDPAGTLELEPSEAAGLPRIRVTTFMHDVEWQGSSGSTTLICMYDRDALSWKAMILLPNDMPETVAALLVGRGLECLLDVPGADAWIIGERQTRMLGQGFHLIRNTVAKTEGLG